MQLNTDQFSEKQATAMLTLKYQKRTQIPKVNDM